MLNLKSISRKAAMLGCMAALSAPGQGAAGIAKHMLQNRQGLDRPEKSRRNMEGVLWAPIRSLVALSGELFTHELFYI